MSPRDLLRWVISGSYVGCLQDRVRSTALPDGPANLTGLTTLHLSGNQLTALPDWLTDLTALEQLLVQGNPLVSPPPEIAAGGSQSVLAFIRAREEGSSAQWVSKLLVVGEGGVGKTSLIKALVGDPYDPGEPTTHGLQIRHLYVDHPSQPSVRMRLSAWDFGGQQIHHATHQFFLTKSVSVSIVMEFTTRLGARQASLLVGHHHGTCPRVADLISCDSHQGPTCRPTDR